MEHHPPAAWLAQAASAAQRQGSGDLLRVVIVVMFVGCALTAWFLLRGYKHKDD
ncbi:hypothetical protein ACWDE0_03380 [Streptomyces sp. 900105755]|uniref:hypothetical protein n=1 Tax=unclassified Streptomyces TaxID=2593676 RepID=UPI000895FC3A|nr:hypothetical protein [Streptomyces sp. Ag109_O5-10]SEF06218.1 hypothetical protein SAMN05216533_5739 [Streptomyces sp. Ag109_O5-10]